MRTEALSPSIEARLSALERQVTRWRRAAVFTVFVLGIGATMAFMQLGPVPLDTGSLTLHGSRGASVTLTLRPSCDLEARFTGITGIGPNGRGSGLALVNPAGREVVRLGEPSARPLGR